MSALNGISRAELIEAAEDGLGHKIAPHDVRGARTLGYITPIRKIGRAYLYRIGAIWGLERYVLEKRRYTRREAKP